MYPKQWHGKRQVKKIEHFSWHIDFFVFFILDLHEKILKSNGWISEA